MKILMTIIICIVYVGVGIQLQKYEIITHPGYWTLYGATFGFIISELRS